MAHRYVNQTMARFSPARSILALVLREMSSTYGSSPGGYIWAIIQPIGIIVVLAFGFSLLVKSPSLGKSFLLFYATGYLTFEIYMQLSNKLQRALEYSRPMLAYPRVIWIDTLIARFLLNFVTMSFIFCIVISVILVMSETQSVLRIEPILIGVAMVASFSVGVGLMNCLIAGLFPVWTIVWQVVNRPMFIASGVLFIYEDLPRTVQNILWWNPVFHATGKVRSGFYPNYEATYVSLTYCFAISGVLIMFGLVFLRAYHSKILGK